MIFIHNSNLHAKYKFTNKITNKSQNSIDSLFIYIKHYSKKITPHNLLYNKITYQAPITNTLSTSLHNPNSILIPLQLTLINFKRIQNGDEGTTVQ